MDFFFGAGRECNTHSVPVLGLGLQNFVIIFVFAQVPDSLTPHCKWQKT